MNEIIAVNREIRAIVGDQFEGENTLLLERNRSEAAKLKRFSVKIRQRIKEIAILLDKQVPPEFGYSVTLGEKEPILSVTLEDGATTEFRTGIKIQPWLSLAEQLNEFDWAATRRLAFSGSQVFDGIVERSKDLPENIPLTEALQRKFEVQTNRFESETTDPRATHVLMWGPHEGLHQETFENAEGFERELPDLMTCGYQVVSIVLRGKVVKAERIDRMKRKALGELKDMPISYAAASGRISPPTILD